MKNFIYALMICCLMASIATTAVANEGNDLGLKEPMASVQVPVVDQAKLEPDLRLEATPVIPKPQRPEGKLVDIDIDVEEVDPQDIASAQEMLWDRERDWAAACSSRNDDLRHITRPFAKKLLKHIREWQTISTKKGELAYNAETMVGDPEDASRYHSYAKNFEDMGDHLESILDNYRGEEGQEMQNIVAVQVDAWNNLVATKGGLEAAIDAQRDELDTQLAGVNKQLAFLQGSRNKTLTDALAESGMPEEISIDLINGKIDVSLAANNLPTDGQLTIVDRRFYDSDDDTVDSDHAIEFDLWFGPNAGGAKYVGKLDEVQYGRLQMGAKAITDIRAVKVEDIDSLQADLPEKEEPEPVTLSMATPTTSITTRNTSYSSTWNPCQATYRCSSPGKSYRVINTSSSSTSGTKVTYFRRKHWNGAVTERYVVND